LFTYEFLSGSATVEQIHRGVMEGFNVEHDFAAFVVSFATVSHESRRLYNSILKYFSLPAETHTLEESPLHMKLRISHHHLAGLTDRQLVVSPSTDDLKVCFYSTALSNDIN
jgi:hypothetical protein